jgi:uncharacterized protein (DUF4415 family)
MSFASRPLTVVRGLSVFARQTEGRFDIMKMKPLTDKSGRVRELTREDIKRFRPAAEVLPQELLAVLPKRKPGQRGVQKMPTKESVTVRYSRDVLEYFRSTGPGWQARIDAVLKEWVAQHGQDSKRTLERHEPTVRGGGRR